VRREAVAPTASRFLLHDATLERTTNGRGTAGELSPGTRWQLDAGGWHSRLCRRKPWPAERMARFCHDNGYFLNIEIKPTPGTERAPAREVANEAARLWQATAVPPLLTSFQPLSLEARPAPRRSCRAACCSTPPRQLAGHRPLAGLCGHRLQPQAVERRHRGAGQGAGFSAA
jgi:hypothetical protein